MHNRAADGNGVKLHPLAVPDRDVATRCRNKMSQQAAEAEVAVAGDERGGEVGAAPRGVSGGGSEWHGRAVPTPSPS